MTIPKRDYLKCFAALDDKDRVAAEISAKVDMVMNRIMPKVMEQLVKEYPMCSGCTCAIVTQVMVQSALHAWASCAVVSDEERVCLVQRTLSSMKDILERSGVKELAMIDVIINNDSMCSEE